MGAHNIEFDIADGPSSDVKKAFDEKRREDKFTNGHQEGYSGDFQTVSTVKIEDKIFDTYREAHEYCLDRAQKWEYVVAVKYREDAKKIKKIVSLESRIRKERQSREELYKKSVKAIQSAKSKTIGCSHCESKVNRKFVKAQGNCPVCNKTLFSNTVVERLKKKDEKIKSLEKDLKMEIKKNNSKGKLRWLIAGWGAC